MTRTAPALLLAAMLGLTACSSNTPVPAPTVTVTAASKAAKLNHTQRILRCAEAIESGKPNGDTAPDCVSLPTDDLFEAGQVADKAAQLDFGRGLEPPAR
jgi:ABC-type glycerol-3-phosphate transport system substrate-binding protein